MRRGRIAAVYVMEDEAGRRKVGHSCNPLRRSFEIDGGAHPLRILHSSTYSAQARKIEHTAHRLLKLAGQHIEGELFSASLDECIAAIERAERIVAGLEPAPDFPQDEPVLVRLKPSMAELVDEWRRGQLDLPTRAEALRRLAAMALEALSEGAKERKPR